MDELKEYELLSAYNALSKTLKLQSGSDFVKLESEVFAEIPDNSYADETAEKLIKELDDSFKNMNVMVKRAVMASVLQVFRYSLTIRKRYRLILIILLCSAMMMQSRRQLLRLLRQ